MTEADVTGAGADVASFARDLARLLSDPDPNATVDALTRDMAWLVALPPAMEEGRADRSALSPLAGLAIFAGTVALVRSGAGERAWPWLDGALDASMRAHPRGHRFGRWNSGLADALAACPELRVAIVEALIAGGRWSDAAHALNDLAEETLDSRPDGFAAPELAAALTAAAVGGWLGPVRTDDAWAFARRSTVIAAGALDERHAHVWKLYAGHLLLALRRGDTAAALALVAAKAEAAARVCDQGHETGNYHFNVLCVLARAGHTAEAVAAARELVRRGYWGLWRLDRKRAADMWWTARSGQLDWLAGLEDAPAYVSFRARYLAPRSAPPERAPPGPFRALHAGVLGGRARKRCAVSSRLIEPGEPVYRFRLYHEHAGDGPLIAAQRAFDASPLASWRDKHAVDGYALADFARVRRRFSAHQFQHPDVARFVFDLAEGGTFDLDRFVDIVVEPHVFPARLTWLVGRDCREPEPSDGPFVNDAVAGEPVNLTALVLRCGHGPALFARLAQRPRRQADPAFAMLATFARADCRAAAARHFGLADLPETMDRAFTARPTLDDVLALADYGRDHPGFADAMAGALARYELHLYSNHHPGVDWYLQDLEHYSCAKGCQLLYLFPHAPERVPVLATMLERMWRVDGVRSGGFDAYDNAEAFFWRAAVTNRMLRAPDEVAAWLDDPRFPPVRGPTAREAARQVAAYRKRTAAAGRRTGRGAAG